MTEEIDEEPQSGSSVSQPRFEPGTFPIFVTNVTVQPACSMTFPINLKVIKAIELIHHNHLRASEVPGEPTLKKKTFYWKSV